jgi:hypothetical protein
LADWGVVEETVAGDLFAAGGDKGFGEEVALATM